MDSHSSTFRKRVLIAMSLAAILVAQAAWSIATTSAVYDETTYLQYTTDAYHSRDLSYWAEKGVAPLPLLLLYSLPALNPSDFIRSITLARVTAVALVGVPLIVFAYWWLAREAGDWIAMAGAAWLALSPNIVAHASLATTDVFFVLGALVALAALRVFIDAPSVRTFTGLAMGVGLASSAKYSAVFLFAVVPLAWVAARPRVSLRSAAIVRSVMEAAAITAALVAATFLMLWLLYGFATAPASVGLVGKIRLPAPVTGLIFQIEHQRGGHFAFLLGKQSGTGWWYYTPITLLLKSTPAELIVLVASLAALATGWRTASTSGLVCRIAFIVFLGLSLLSRVDAGVRYVLLLIPLALFIAVQTWLPKSSVPVGNVRSRSVSEKSGHAPSRSAAPTKNDRNAQGYPARSALLGARQALLRRAPSARGLPVAAAIVLLQVSSAVLIAPHYLSYFNVFAGGPANGYRYLADSNVDWGQDLPALRAALARVGASRPLLAYFGTAPLEPYGVSGVRWMWGTPALDQSYDWIAISATFLDGVYIGDAFAPFREIDPSDRAGYSILLYDARRPEVRRAVELTQARLR